MHTEQDIVIQMVYDLTWINVLLSLGCLKYFCSIVINSCYYCTKSIIHTVLNCHSIALREKKITSSVIQNLLDKQMIFDKTISHIIWITVKILTFLSHLVHYLDEKLCSVITIAISILGTQYVSVEFNQIDLSSFIDSFSSNIFSSQNKPFHWSIMHRKLS